MEGREDEVPSLYFTCQSLEGFLSKLTVVSGQEDEEIAKGLSLAKKFLDSNRTLIYCDGPWGVSEKVISAEL